MPSAMYTGTPNVQRSVDREYCRSLFASSSTVHISAGAKTSAGGNLAIEASVGPATLQRFRNQKTSGDARSMSRPSWKTTDNVAAHGESMTGTIRTLRTDRGFGFIKDAGGKEHFFHQSAVQGEGINGSRGRLGRVRGGGRAEGASRLDVLVRTLSCCSGSALHPTMPSATQTARRRRTTTSSIPSMPDRDPMLHGLPYRMTLDTQDRVPSRATRPGNNRRIGQRGNDGIRPRFVADRLAYKANGVACRRWFLSRRRPAARPLAARPTQS